MKWDNLEIAEGLRVSKSHLAQLWDMILECTWGRPQLLVCDSFRLAELEDAVEVIKVRLEPRISRLG